jgi:hypothetical protein
MPPDITNHHVACAKLSGGVARFESPFLSCHSFDILNNE